MPRQIATFYRYRGFSTNTLDSLCHDTLYFANPGTFNDPLDCSPTLERDSSLEELRNLLSVLMRRRVRSEVLASLSQARIKGDGATAHAEKRAISEARSELANIAYNATNPDYTVSKTEAEEWLLISEIERELRRHYELGVCCFSTTYTSPLLWSHYGDQHRGLCIGYGLDRKPKPEMHRVFYGGSRSVRTSTLIRALVDEDLNAKKELDRDVLLRKARGWNYEKEYRLLGVQGEQDSPLLLKEVTFGLRCPMSVVHAVIKSLVDRGESMRYFKMYEVHGRFMLRRAEVNLQELDMYMPKTAQSGLEIFGDSNGSSDAAEGAA
ncbi:MAG: hypothetical protein CFE44_14345 [Burkholderiales bacterium PBB4]|nr:MAG: hypothetical protein CFE44_14345 [Burkholderiales bacterium PBB4]